MPRFLPRIASSTLAAFGLLLASTVPGAAQPPEDDPDSPFGDRLSVGYVLVPVVVRSPSGYVTDLDRSDFRLFVDGEPLDFDSFESGPDGPISVLFAQDLSGSMGVPPKLDISRRIVHCFLDQKRPGDRFALASFAAELVTVDVPFTQDLDALEEGIARWEGYGRTALHDAVAWLPRITLSEASMRRAAVLVTDGVDNASSLEPQAARESVRSAELPVFVFGLSTGDPFAIDGEGDKIFRYADVLNLLAALSGGQYHSTLREDEIDTACREIVAELRHQYVLGFPLAADGPAGHHRLEIEVDGRRRRVRSRDEYFGRAPRRAPRTTAQGGLPR